MGYLSNRTINYLNLHAAFLSLLEQAFGLFVPLYFYKLGFPLHKVFFTSMLFNVVRIPLRLFAFPIVRKLGLRNALMIGSAGYGLSFPILSLVKGYDIWLVVNLIEFGIFNSLYWHCYHTYYSMAGEAEHRGKQLAIAQGLSTAVSAAAPFLSALYISHSGFNKFFFFAIPLMLAMIITLIPCQNIPAGRTSWREGKKQMFSLGAKIHFFESSAIWPLSLAWVFVVYLFVDKLVILGGLVTFGIVFQILYQLWLGGVLDRGKGRRVANIAGALRLTQVFVKVFCPLSLFTIPCIQALSGATDVHHALSQSTTMYNTGKNTDDPFWYWLFAETAFDFGTIVGAGGLALLTYYGLELRYTILLAIPGTLAVWYLISRYFKYNAAESLAI